jgi:hypothetical protein
MSSSSLRTAALRGGEGATALALPLPLPLPCPRSDFAGCDVPEGRMRSEGSVPRGETHGVPRRGGIGLVGELALLEQEGKLRRRTDHHVRRW